MASLSTSDLAARLVGCLGATESQGSVASQAQDVEPVVRALGYADLSNLLLVIAAGGHVVIRRNRWEVMGESDR